MALMFGLVAGCALGLALYFGTLSEGRDARLPSTDTTAGAVDETEAFIISRGRRSKAFAIPPDTPLARSDPFREALMGGALQWIDGPAGLELVSAAMARKDYRTAIALIEAAYGTDATVADSAVGRLYASALAGRAGQIMAQSPAEAHRLATAAIAVDPARADAYVIRGNLYTRSKAYPQAIGAYRQALAINPGLTDALFNLGYIYASTGRLAEAEKMLARVVAQKPPYLDKALFNQAVVQQRLGKVTESIRTLEAALAIRPDNERVRQYLQQMSERSP
jgi:tetratricopeptide (TPR) repeat protein